jgi:beta-mannosidase
VWSYNDCWGETGWSIIDHYARRKPSFYWFKRASRPVKVIVRAREGQLATRVVNDTLETYRAVVRYGWYRLDGTQRVLQEKKISIPADGMIDVASAAMAPPNGGSPREWLYAATLEGRGLPNDQSIWLLAPHRELALSRPEITSRVREGVLEVRSPVYCHGVHLEDGGHEVLADNYFELLPGVPCRIPITTRTASNEYPWMAVMPLAQAGKK